MDITWGGLFLIIVLGILIIIWAISRLVNSSHRKNITEEKSETTVIPETGTDININEEDEEELIAVITAAVAAILKKPVSGFRVVSFKKKNNWR
jgi:sodium pump decarboxylase gamma subunit